MNKRIIALLLAMAMLLTCLVGCGNAGEGEGDVGKTVVIGYASDLKTLDPAYMYEVFGNMYSYAAYDMLFRFEKDDTTKPIPSLVTDTWTLDTNGMVYTFPLREDVKFSSGNQLTAKDVVFTINRVINLKSNTFPHVEGVASVVADGDYKVIITLKAPDASFLAKLASNAYCIVDSEVVKANGGTDAADAATTDTAQTFLDKNSAGSGPYILESWSPNVELVIKKNPNYWGETGNVERYIFKEIPDPNTQIQMLNRGEIDIAYSLSADNVSQVEGADGVHAATGQTNIISFLMMNSDPEIGGPVADPKVQQAIRYAIKYQELLDLCGEGASLPMGFVPSGMIGGLTKDANYRNIEKAKELMKEAGYEEGFETTLTTANFDTEGMQWTTIAQKITSDLAEIGIKVKVATSEIGVVIDEYRNGKTPFLVMHWSPDYIDINSQLAFLPDNTVGLRANWSAAGKEEIIDLGNKIKVESDNAKREQFSKELQQKMAEDCPYAFLLQHSRNFAVADSITNIYYNDVAKIQVKDLTMN